MIGEWERNWKEDEVRDWKGYRRRQPWPISN
jgi:hypothetical protein